jgi:hypothetical protein
MAVKPAVMCDGDDLGWLCDVELRSLNLRGNQMVKNSGERFGESLGQGRGMPMGRVTIAKVVVCGGGLRWRGGEKGEI